MTTLRDRVGVMCVFRVCLLFGLYVKIQATSSVGQLHRHHVRLGRKILRGKLICELFYKLSGNQRLASTATNQQQTETTNTLKMVDESVL